MIAETPEVIYSSYTEAQKRATTKYRTNNKDKVNEKRKEYYKQRKEADPEFLEYKRNKAKEYYQRKKEMKDSIKQLEEIEKESEKEVVIEPTPEAVVEPEKTIPIEIIKPVKKPRKSKAIKPLNTEIIDVIHDGPVLKLRINGEEFKFKHDPSNKL
jgi:hypothetical protein